MANLTINISPVDVDPENTIIYPGDTVTFALVHRTDAVTVTFPNGSPFSTNSVPIPGGATLLSSPKTVRADVVASTSYHFNAPGLSDPDPQPDQPGTLSGGLEVGADRPPE